MSARTRRLITSTWAALFVFSLLLQYASFAAPAATQAYVGNSATSPFELDGNAIHSTGHDWDQVFADRNGPPYPDSGAANQIFATDGTGLGDDILTGGNTKDTIDISSWLWDQTSTTSVQDKDDIENAFAAAYTAQNGHTVGYFGLDRFSISGDATAGFWFFKNGIAKTNVASQGAFKFSGVHAEGDVLVVMDFSNGGANGTATVYEWHNGALVNTNVTGGECDGTTNQSVCAITNIVDATSPWPYTPKSGTANIFPAAPVKNGQQGAGALYEGGIDLTALGLDVGCFSTFMAETRSSNTPTSTLSDFVLGNFSFCETPDLQTQASPSSVTIGGGSVTDLATLTGTKGTVAGTVDFFVCGPSASNPDCTSGGQKVGATKTLSGGQATSDGFTPGTAGDYCFRAEYTPASGSKYLPATHTNQGSECFTVNKASPAISTSAAETVDVGQVIHDSAALSGGFNPTGTITFKLYGPNDATCSNAAVFTDTRAVSGNGSYGPVSYTTAAAGTYHWIASYGGDANNNAVSGQCNDTGENDVASKVTPTLATTASGSVVVGGVISDTATVTGGFDPTGTVTFNLYGPSDQTCSAAPVFTSPNRPLTSGSATSAGFTTSQAGTYHWIASYSGDANNDPVTGACGDSNESVVVTKASPSIATTLVGGTQSGSSITVSLGTAVHDTSTLSDATADAGGTVHYQVFSNAQCTGTAQDAGTVTVTNGNVPDSNPITFNTAGTYYWQADYSGDGNNDPATSPCNLETVVVQKNIPTISTSGDETVVIGNAISDTAQLAGGFSATGTITFKAFGPNDAACSAAAVFTDTRSVSGNGSYGPVSFTPSAPGTYRWIASYGGDVNNAPVSGSCNDQGETDTVIKASPAISTAASAPVIVGGQISDGATVTGGFGPTGTVTFVLYGPNDATCSTAIFTSADRPLSAGHASSAPFTTSAVGTYRWIATYNGDANNNSVSGNCNDANESVVVSKATPSIATTASGSVTVGGQIGDSATVSGGFNPSGTVTFVLYGPDDATCANPIFTSADRSLSAGSASSAMFTTSAAGTYRWIATYNGDANNNSVSGNCNDANESVVVTKAPPSIVTSASEGGTPGHPISDTATLSGGFDPTGTITFKLFGPEASPTCSAQDQVFTATVPVDGNGDYLSGNFVPTTSGMYFWIASYSGDANNLSATGSCGDPGESTTVSQFAPTITTSLSSGDTSGPKISVLFGSAVTDQATLSGADPTAGGSVTYTVYSDNTCDTFYADGGTKTVTAGVVPASDPVTFPTPGVFYWQAHYSGDVNDAPATSACQDEVVTVTTPHLTAEKLVAVNDGTPSHSTTANPGDTLTYTITITNSGDAGATNVPVSDDISAILAHAAFVSCTGGCDHSTSTLTWTIPSIAANGGTASVSFQVDLDASFPEGTTTLPNTVVVTGPGSNCAEGSDDAACSTTTTVEAAPALSVEKRVAVNDGDFVHTSTAKPGDILTYGILVVNSGDAPATNVPVSDDINAVLAHGTYNGDCSDGCTESGGVLSWTIPSIAAGDSILVTFSVTLSATFPVGVTDLPNTVVVVDTNCEEGSEDAACSTTTTVNQPALTIAKSFTGNSLPPTTIGNHPQAAEGDKLTYTLAYTLTSGPVTNAVITDVLPAGQTYVTGSATGNDEFTFESYDATTRTLSWTAPTATKSGSVTYQVTIDKGASGLAQPLTNTATIVSDETAPDSATADVFVPAPPKELTPPPTDTLPDRGAPGNPGFTLMLLLLGLAAFALALGAITPVPERVRQRDRR